MCVRTLCLLFAKVFSFIIAANNDDDRDVSDKDNSNGAIITSRKSERGGELNYVKPQTEIIIYF